MRRGVVCLLAILALMLAGCGDPGQGTDPDPDQVDSVDAPPLGACRTLSTDDLGKPANATRTVSCASEHNSQTYAVGELPPDYAASDYDSDEVGEFAHRTCSSEFASYLGADELLAMRTIVTWVWFRPSATAWDEGARWYRCDVVGGGAQTAELLDLPTTARDLLAGGPKDKWLACASGSVFATSTKVPCSRRHDWRAVTAVLIAAGEDGSYPGDAKVVQETKDRCAAWVQSWLNYEVDFDYAYTWFGEDAWNSGNRRSVCWARTPE